MIRKLLVANRSEIAIRIFRAATELGIRTVAVYAEQDKLSLHRFKADEAYAIGEGAGPIEAYLSVSEIIRVALESGADAIHPGYGFLAESPELADACSAAGLLFVGPSPATMRLLGDKVAARALALRVGAPVMPASDALPADPDSICGIARGIGYPVMLKASWGGGGRGMRPVESEEALLTAVDAARRESQAAFGKPDIYLEKLLRRARHIEVQILGDSHGQIVHLFERDCSVQRRHQKIVEQAPSSCITAAQQAGLYAAAVNIAREAQYVGAGTIEFLLDVDTGQFWFIEANPRIQVEHTVTEVVTGIDIAKAQIRIAEGGRIGWMDETGVPHQSDIRLNGFALQCRITTEDPENGFIPDYGRISAYRGAFGFGIRVDGGTAYAGATVTRFYDPLLEKVTAWAPSRGETIARMRRALREYRIRGLTTNLAFLQAIVEHAKFESDDYTTRFIDDTPGLLNLGRRNDRATKLLRYIADVSVNGHPETRNRPVPRKSENNISRCRPVIPMDESPRERLARIGPEAFARWMRELERPLVTDTTMRDAHQSLLATRVRTKDIVGSAPCYASGLPDLLSLECWGGATFDVALRFLHEDPWERLAQLREKSPRALLQMLLRGANAVGYANYPDNVVRFFIHQAAAGGIDLFRIFDCFNWSENMRVAIDAVRETGKIAEGAICYTGDITDPSRTKYPLRYYVDLAKSLVDAGCHVIAIKDMAGLLKPAAAQLLVKAIRDEVGAPLHLHTHDTSGLGGATILAAVEAGVDAFDAAMDSMSSTTSQPCLGSLVSALSGAKRDTGLDISSIRQISNYWKRVRQGYAAFETDLRSAASEVYLHELPGGQFTNLQEQARALGLGHRWDEVASAYRSANELCGDIIKVTPSSKVVGDMALMMVSQGLSANDVADPGRDISFPQSVVEMMRGDLGQPPGGWPEALQRKVLQGSAADTSRPGSRIAPTDLSAARLEASAACGRPVDDFRLATSLMYPAVFRDFCEFEKEYGPVAGLPTRTFFYGMTSGEEITVELERGKTLVIRLLAIGETDASGKVRVFFELNGQPRNVKVPNRAIKPTNVARPKADARDATNIAAPMPGIISAVLIQEGEAVEAGQPMIVIEAMKMLSQITSPHRGRITRLHVAAGDAVDAKDLLIIVSDLTVAERQLEKVG